MLVCKIYLGWSIETCVSNFSFYCKSFFFCNIQCKNGLNGDILNYYKENEEQKCYIIKDTLRKVVRKNPSNQFQLFQAEAIFSYIKR